MRISITIPVLDDPFTPAEIEQTVKCINKNKSYSGVCPRLIANLPVPWLVSFEFIQYDIPWDSLSYAMVLQEVSNCFSNHEIEWIVKIIEA